MAYDVSTVARHVFIPLRCHEGEWLGVESAKRFASYLLPRVYAVLFISLALTMYLYQCEQSFTNFKPAVQKFCPPLPSIVSN